MSVNVETTCIFCSKILEQFEAVDGTTRKMVDLLLLKVALDTTQNSIMCKDCAQSVKTSYYFKLFCINTITRKHSRSDKHIIENVVDMDFCQFCLNQTERENVTVFDDLTIKVKYVELLPVLMPEMDFNIRKSLIICAPCKVKLEGYLKFAHKCLDVKIRTTIHTHNKKYDIHCNSLSKDILEHHVDDNQVHTVKQEIDLNEDIQKVHPELYVAVKSEETLIKDEEVNLNENCNERLPATINEHNDIQSDTISSEGDIYKCELCAYQTKRKGDAKRHTLTHKSNSEVKMYKCRKCTYMAKYRDNLKKHMLVHENIPEIKMYKCEVCNYHTKQRGNLKKHMLVHRKPSEIDVYKCAVCGHETNRIYYLNKHMHIHKASKIYKCIICTYETKNKCLLKTHMLTHMDASEGDMYKCSTCSYKTKRRDHLKSHILTHGDPSEVEMYKCAMCTFETKRKRYLKWHMLVHREALEVEVYKCSVCSYETKRKDNLKSHILRHEDASAIKMHKCLVCPFVTKRKCYIKSHILTHRDPKSLNAQM